MTLLEQALPLAGVAVGAGLSYATASLTERARWNRERATRWDERRLDALVEFASALKVETRLCLRMASFMGMGPVTDPLDPKAGLPRLSEAEDHRSTTFERLLLLVDSETVKTARAWQQDVWELHRFVESSHQSSGFLEAYGRAGVSREQFHEQARRLTVAGAMSASDSAPDGRAKF